MIKAAQARDRGEDRRESSRQAVQGIQVRCKVLASVSFTGTFVTLDGPCPWPQVEE
jgi:hypothetical protein